MLQGNDKMVKALDLTDAEDIDAEIGLLQQAMARYAEAVNGYLALLTGGPLSGFLASQLTRVDPLTGQPSRLRGRGAPGLGVGRRAQPRRAGAGRAPVPQGEHGPGPGNPDPAWAQADVELPLLASCGPASSTR